MKDISINKKTLKENSPLIGGLVLFLFAFFIVIRVILPLVTSIFDTREEITAQESRNQTLRDSQQAIASINNANIEENLTLTKTALPQNKDIVLTYTSVLDVASELGMQLEGFSVSVGQVYGDEPIESAESPAVPQAEVLPSIVATVQMAGSSESSLFEFPKLLTQKLPLAKVTTLQIEGGSAQYEIVFYYKPLNVEALGQQEIVEPLTPQEQVILNQLGTMDE